MNEHDTVVLTRAIPNHGLEAGDVGAIVHVYESGKAFEVEFVAGESTLAVLTLDTGEIRAVDNSEILHVRKIAA